MDASNRGGGGQPLAAPPLLELKGLTKRFPGVLALDAVDLAVAPGEIHGLVGQNGAGKSTLIKILSGAYSADGGEMRLGGGPYRPASPQDALQGGIRVVYQEFGLLPYLSVGENLFFDNLPRRLGIFVDRRALEARAKALLERVGLDVEPDTPVEHLGVAQMQLLEIAKAVSAASRLLILDEPTSALTPRETARLFQIVRNLHAERVTVIYISHHLQEIFDLCGNVTVLRNGRKVGTFAVRDTTAPELVHMMIGRRLQEAPTGGAAPAQEAKSQAPPALRVENLRVAGNPHGISLELRYGEIVGLAGLVGSGRTETLRAIFGADRREGGAIYRDGRPVSFKSPAQAVEHGVCLLTEKRKEQGLVLPMSAGVNVTLTDLARISRLGLLDPAAERTAAQHWVEELDIRVTSPDQPALNLSGGNQQKLVVAKWLFRDAQVLLLDEPTRGIDVGAKAEIYELMRNLAAQGKALLVVSSELSELIAHCDRILILSRGRLVRDLARRDFDEELILSLAYSEYLRTGREAPGSAI